MADLNTFIQAMLCNILIYNSFINRVHPIWKSSFAVLLSEQSLEIRIEQTPSFKVFFKKD